MGSGGREREMGVGGGGKGWEGKGEGRLEERGRLVLITQQIAKQSK